MKILLLGPAWRNAELKTYLEYLGDECLMSQDEITPEFIDREGIQVILSAGYHLRIKPDVIAAADGFVVNLHATYLPWGKGIGTTFFAYLLGHPTGVSVHYIDNKIDTGDIIVQRPLDRMPKDTLRTFYHFILDETEKLFRENWPAIREGKAPRITQSDFDVDVPYFSRTDSEAFMDQLPKKWDTPLEVVELWGAEMAVSEEFWRLYEDETSTA